MSKRIRFLTVLRSGSASTVIVVRARYGNRAGDDACSLDGYFGGLLLAEALRKAVAAGDAAAARLVVVDAIDDAAARFYAHHGFLAVPEHSMRLYRRVKEIRASLDPGANSDG